MWKWARRVRSGEVENWFVLCHWVVRLRVERDLRIWDGLCLFGGRTLLDLEPLSHQVTFTKILGVRNAHAVYDVVSVHTGCYRLRHTAG